LFQHELGLSEGQKKNTIPNKTEIHETTKNPTKWLFRKAKGKTPDQKKIEIHETLKTQPNDHFRKPPLPTKPILTA
jgi:hypothetical protein